jgi:alkanesulfonate monooxygenase SsuD/methylene tetrahydromethanopterin reductase-like flavin-dependent oxidoreductase (luciferase family)
MKFGLFGGATSGAAGPAGDSQAYRDFIDYVLEAEDLGYYSVFLVEHHFTGLGQISSSLNLLSYLAAQTSTLRLGTAVTVLPWHNPVLLAEQAATVDLLSSGRLDFGIGRGYRDNEFHGFGIPASEAAGRYEEALQIILKAWTAKDRFSHHGERWHYNDIIVEPHPVQTPHPPIWMAAGSGTSLRTAAERGFGVLIDQNASFEVVAERVQCYRDRLEETGKEYQPGNVAVTRAVSLVYTEAEREEAVSRRIELLNRTKALAHAGGSGASTPNAMKDLFFSDTRRATEEGAIIGDPDECIARLQLLRDAGVEQVLLTDPLGSPQRLKLFAKDVIPAAAEWVSE